MAQKKIDNAKSVKEKSEAWKQMHIMTSIHLAEFAEANWADFLKFVEKQNEMFNKKQKENEAI